MAKNKTDSTKEKDKKPLFKKVFLGFFFLVNKEVSLVFPWASMIMLFTSSSLDFLLRCFHKWQPLSLSFRALTFLEVDIFSDCPTPILHSPIPYSNRGSSKTARLRCVVVRSQPERKFKVREDCSLFCF